MKIPKLNILLFLTLVTISITLQTFPFQRKVFTFWSDPDITKAPILVQICYQRLQQQTKKANLQHIHLNQDTIKSYITDYQQKITKVRQKTFQKTIQHYSDLIRFHLIYQHGGIWVDMTTFVLDDFEGLINIKDNKYKKYLTNRFSEDPDVLLCYLGEYQNSAEYRIPNPKNSSDLILYNYLPGYEVWFVAAKKQSAYIKEVIELYKEFSEYSQQTVMNKFLSEDIYFNPQDAGLYLMGNMLLSYAMNKKQRELDQQNTFGLKDRQKAFDHYKLWSLKAQVGPLFWTNTQLFHRYYYPFKSMQFLIDNQIDLQFFIKITGEFRDVFDRSIALHQDVFNKRDLNFVQYLETHPPYRICQEQHFILNNSLIYTLASKTQVFKKLNIKPITEVDLDKWLYYCSQRQFFGGVYQLLQPLANYLQPKTFVNYGNYLMSHYRQNIYFYQNQQQSPTFIQLIKQWYKSHDVSIRIFIRTFIFTGFQLVFMVALMVLVWKLINQQQYPNGSFQQKKYSFWKQFKKVTTDKPFYFMYFLLSVSFYGQVMVFFYGVRDYPATLIFYILFQVFAYLKLKKLISNSQQQSKWIPIIFKLFEFQFFYSTGFCLLSMFTQNYHITYFMNIILSGGGSFLLNSLQRAQSVLTKQKQNNTSISIFRYLHHNYLHLIAVLTIPLLLVILPSITHIYVGQKHLVFYLPIVLILYLVILWYILLDFWIKKKNNYEIYCLIGLGYLIVLNYFLMHVKYQGNKIPLLVWNLFVGGIIAGFDGFINMKNYLTQYHINSQSLTICGYSVQKVVSRVLVFMILEQSVLYLTGFLINITAFRLLEYCIILITMILTIVVFSQGRQRLNKNDWKQNNQQNKISKRDYLQLNEFSSSVLQD